MKEEHDKWLKEYRRRQKQNSKTLKGRALILLDHLLCNDSFGDDKFLCLLYRIAHSTSGVCDNKHEDWVMEIERLYKEEVDG